MTKAQLLDKLTIAKQSRRNDLIKIESLQKALNDAELEAKNANDNMRKTLEYDKHAPLVKLHARGGWWCVRDRPRGKGSASKDGWYVRIRQNDTRIKEHLKRDWQDRLEEYKIKYPDQPQ